MENFLTRSAVARELQISESCVGVWAQSGKLPATKTTGGKLLFRESDIRKKAEELAAKRAAKDSKD